MTSSFTIANLDAAIAIEKPNVAIRSDYTALRDVAFKQAMAKYVSDTLLPNADPLAINNTLSLGSAPATGSALLNTGIFDVYKIALDASALKVYGDTIWVEKNTTSTFFSVKRKSISDIETDAVDGQTLYAFFETNGEIILCVKDGEFTAPVNVHYLGIRKLDTTTSPDSTAIECYDTDFETIKQLVLEALPE